MLFYCCSVELCFYWLRHAAAAVELNGPPHATPVHRTLSAIYAILSSLLASRQNEVIWRYHTVATLWTSSTSKTDKSFIATAAWGPWQTPPHPHRWRQGRQTVLGGTMLLESATAGDDKRTKEALSPALSLSLPAPSRFAARLFPSVLSLARRRSHDNRGMERATM